MAGGLALAAVTAVAAASGGRLLVEPGGAFGAVVTGLFVHALLRVAFARRWGQVAMTLALAGGLVLVGCWAVVPSATVYGMPAPRTIEALVVGLHDGMLAIRTGALPAPPDGGVEVAMAAAAAVVAIASDRLAFANQRPLVALMPALGIVAVTSAMGDDRGQVVLVVAFVAACVVFLLAARPTTSQWSVVRAGIPLVLVGAVTAPLLGPYLPAARADGLVELGEPSKANRDRVAVSPLLSVRDLLAGESVELFTVGAAVPAYWRLTSLDTYDGGVWKSDTKYRPARGRFPADASAPFATESLTQNFAVSRLAQFWLPAAYRPVSVDLAGARVSDESLALITEEPSAAGLSYTVRSELPRYSAAELFGAGGRVPEEVRPFLLLPSGLPADIAGLTAQVAGGEPTPYERALALQNFFRRQFTYSTETQGGHSEDHLRDFLFESRKGYCEQFAAAFALMGRWLGLPTRVAVGFTPGTYDPSLQIYRVTSADAHAWPEVYLDPYGWVPFEPTPERFDPSPADHTGTYDADLYVIHVEPGVVRRAEEGTFQENQVVVEDVPKPPGGDGAGDGRAPPPVASSPAFTRVRVWVGIALLLAAAVAVWVMALRHLARRRRRALSARASIVVAWTEVADRLRAKQVEVTEAETPREVVDRARHEATAPIVDDLAGLAGIVETAVYGADEPGLSEVADAWRHRDAVVKALRRA